MRALPVALATVLVAALAAGAAAAQAPTPPARPTLALGLTPTPSIATYSTSSAFGRLAALPPRPAAGSDVFRLMALNEAAKAGLPYALVDAVMKIESGYQPDRIGDVGEIGLMQVRPGTAAMLGFKGTPAALADPATNIHYGATYLGQAWRLTNGDVCRTLMKYRAGHGSEVMSALSASYCARARAHLVAVGSPLAAMITPAVLTEVKEAVVSASKSANASRPAVPGVGRARSGTAFWAALEAKVGKINARLESRWRKVAAK